MESSSVVSELEGTLLKDPDPFSYYMLVAFEASGLIRFALLLLLWPGIRVLEIMGFEEAGLKIMIFVAVSGLREKEIESVARAVLPKFYMDDVDMEAWRAFSSFEKRVAVTKTPRIMVERFAKEHLRADEVVGTELAVNRFGFVTGFVEDGGGDRIGSKISHRVAKIFLDEPPSIGLGTSASSLSSLCKVSHFYILDLDSIVIKTLKSKSYSKFKLIHDTN